MTRMLLAAAALLLTLGAQADDDFAWQWPLHLSAPDAGVYEITLTDEVYRAAYWRDWHDVRVLDADGRIMDSARYPAPVTSATHTIELPWFPLPEKAQTGDLGLFVQRDDNGRIRTIRETGTPAQTADPGWLVDTGEYLHLVRAIRVEWTDPEASFDIGYRVETSDDLSQWRVLESEVRLLHLGHDRQILSRNTFPLSTGTAQRYLRMLPLQRSGTPIPKALHADVVQMTTFDDWQWLDLPAQRTEDGEWFGYRMPGFFPIQRLDLQMPANSSAVWRIASEDDGIDGIEPARRRRVHAAHWHTFQLAVAGEVQRSPPLQPSQMREDGERNRVWLLQPESGALPADAPVLRLGWRPERLLFLAQGRAPYQLVAGHARPQQDDPAHGAGVIALRGNASANGLPWQPGQTLLGARQLRAGDAAYRLPPTPRDWTTPLLWGVLILGSALVAWFAFSVLRARPAPDGDHQHGPE